MLLLFGCAPPEPPPTWAEVSVTRAELVPDADQDGTPDEEDCRPEDATVHPGAPERCDGVDQDCDGGVDEAPTDGAPQWPDLDGDGVGTGTPETLCPGTPGFAAVDGDCDDADAAIHPAAPERCDRLDNDCDGAVDDADPDVVDRISTFVDADGDGFGAGEATQRCAPASDEATVAGDCDDTVATIHPGATERCDAVDDDCDTLVDDLDPDVLGQRTGWLDTDGDGFGGATPTTACVLPDNAVALDGDCDDADPLTSPVGTEVCSGADEDCDGLVDDADPGVVGAPTGWEDDDGDGWGGTTAVTACALPDTLASEDGDCDDADAAIHPDAEERCGGADEDCDGLTDLGDPSLTDPHTVYDDDDGDGFAGGAAYTACTGEIVATDCDDGDPAAFPGAPETCTSGDLDCDGRTADADPDVLPTTTWYVDLDHDGFGTDATLACAGDTLTPGDCDDTDATVAPDAAETCNNDRDDDCDPTTVCGLPDLAAPADADATLTRAGSLGFAQALYVDDLDGDAIADLLVSEPGADEGAPDAGAVWFVPGPFVGGDVRASAWATVRGDADSRIGGIVTWVDGAMGVSVGEDLYLFEAPIGALTLADATSLYLGCETLVSLAATRVCASPEDATLTTYDLDGSVLGTLTGDADAAGADLSAADLDGDGIAELWVGAPGNDAGGDGAGAVYAVTDADGALDDVGTALLGVSSDSLGWVTHAAGDLDGDGREDLVIGAPGADTVLIIGGIAPGAVRDTAFASVTGDGTQGLGRGGAASGDFDGDGAQDLVLGGPGDRAGAGTTWVWYGPVGGAYDTVGDVQIAAADERDGLGARFGVAAGDADGDGVDDLLLASPDEEVTTLDAGAVFLFPGGGL